jgi:hypothetical protein
MNTIHFYMSVKFRVFTEKGCKSMKSSHDTLATDNFLISIRKCSPSVNYILCYYVFIKLLDQTRLGASSCHTQSEECITEDYLQRAYK